MSGEMDTDNNTTLDTTDYSMIKHTKIIIEGVALPLVGCIGIFGKILREGSQKNDESLDIYVQTVGR